LKTGILGKETDVVGSRHRWEISVPGSDDTYKKVDARLIPLKTTSFEKLRVFYALMEKMKTIHSEAKNQKGNPATSKVGKMHLTKIIQLSEDPTVLKYVRMVNDIRSTAQAVMPAWDSSLKVIEAAKQKFKKKVEIVFKKKGLEDFHQDKIKKIAEDDNLKKEFTQIIESARKLIELHSGRRRLPGINDSDSIHIELSIWKKAWLRMCGWNRPKDVPRKAFELLLRDLVNMRNHEMEDILRAKRKRDWARTHIVILLQIMADHALPEHGKIDPANWVKYAKMCKDFIVLGTKFFLVPHLAMNDFGNMCVKTAIVLVGTIFKLATKFGFITSKMMLDVTNAFVDYKTKEKLFTALIKILIDCLATADSSMFDGCKALKEKLTGFNPGLIFEKHIQNMRMLSETFVEIAGFGGTAIENAGNAIKELTAVTKGLKKDLMEKLRDFYTVNGASACEIRRKSTDLVLAVQFAEQMSPYPFKGLRDLINGTEEEEFKEKSNEEKMEKEMKNNDDEEID
jgi:hypothetical protein